MEVAKGVGVGLLDRPFDTEDEEERTPEGDAPVYSMVRDLFSPLGFQLGGLIQYLFFAVFKSFAVVFPLAKLLTFNIVTLIVGPIVLILFLVCERVFLAPRNESTETRPALHWLQAIWRHAKFWVALAVAIGWQVLLTWLYIALNPFVRFIFVLTTWVCT